MGRAGVPMGCAALLPQSLPGALLMLSVCVRCTEHHGARQVSSIRVAWELGPGVSVQLPENHCSVSAGGSLGHPDPPPSCSRLPAWLICWTVFLSSSQGFSSVHGS